MKQKCHAGFPGVQGNHFICKCKTGYWFEGAYICKWKQYSQAYIQQQQFIKRNRWIRCSPYRIVYFLSGPCNFFIFHVACWRRMSTCQTQPSSTHYQGADLLTKWLFVYILTKKLFICMEVSKVYVNDMAIYEAWWCVLFILIRSPLINWSLDWAFNVTIGLIY